MEHRLFSHYDKQYIAQPAKENGLMKWHQWGKLGDITHIPRSSSSLLLLAKNLVHKAYQNRQLRVGESFPVQKHNRYCSCRIDRDHFELPTV
jgi:hypothetical protein